MATSPDRLEEMRKKLEANPLPTMPQQRHTPDARLEQMRAQLAEDPASSEQESSFLGEAVSTSDLQQISRKTGIGIPMLTKALPAYGLVPEGADATTKTMAALQLVTSEGALLGLPQFLAKKMADPRSREAMDALRELANRKKSGLATGLEIAGGLLTGGASLKAAKALGGGLTGAATVASAETGTAFMTRSDEGEELSEFLKGAAIGVAVPPGFAAIGAGARGLARMGGAIARRSSPPVKESVNKGIDELVDAAESTRQANAPYEDLMEAAAVKGEVAPIQNFKTFRALPEEVKKAIPEARVPKNFRSAPSYREAVGEAGSSVSTKDIASDYKKWVRVRSELIEFTTRKVKPSKTKEAAPKKVAEALKSLEDIRKQIKPEELSKEFRNFRRTNYMIEQAGKLGLKATRKSSEVGSKIFRFLSDAQYVVQDIDERFGTELLPVLHNLSRRGRDYQSKAYVATTAQKTLDKMARKANLTGEEVGAIIDQPVDQLQKSLQSMSPQQREVVENWRTLWETLREQTNQDYGTQIAKLAGRGYIPKAVKRGPRLTEAVASKEKELMESLGVDDIDMAAEKVIQEGSDYIKGLSLVYGQKIATAADLRLARKMVYDPLGPEHLSTARLRKAKAAQQRGASEIPQWLQEKDVNELLVSYLNNTVRTAALREGLSQMGESIRYLNSIGRREDASYLNNLYEDIMGVRTGTLSHAAKRSATLWEQAMTKRAAQAEAPAEKLFYEFSADMPSYFRAATRQLYPFYLGLRIDNVFRNLTQPFTLTAGELAVKGSKTYGLKKVSLGTADAFSLVLNPKFSVDEFLQGKGLMAPHQQFEAIGWSREGVQSSFKGTDTLTRMGKEKAAAFLEASNNVAMWMYTKSDSINRLVTYQSAARVMDDLAKGMRAETLTASQKASMDYFQKQLPSSTRKQISRLLQKGDINEAREQFAGYLIGRTQFNYDRISMNEYGRWFGGMFAMFSKWPASIGGEIGLGLRQAARGGKDLPSAVSDQVSALISDPKNIVKFWGPLVSVAAAEALLPESRKSELRKQTLGGSMLSWAPVSSLGGPLTGDIGSPPVFDLGVQTVRTLLERKPERLWKSVGPFIPGATYLDFMMNDIHKWQKATK